jgi:hypothetical protein
MQKDVTIKQVTVLCEKNKVKYSALCCIYCGKSYKTKLNLDKHLILCEITHKSKRSSSDSNLDDDDNDLIHKEVSSKKLYEIVMQLALKCNRLEHKVADLSKHVSKQHKKLDIIDYLNNITHATTSATGTDMPILVFENITELIIVEQSDIEFLFYNSFIDTVNNILSRSIYGKQTNNSILPIAAFTQKTNTIYVYTKNNNNQTSSSSPHSQHWSIVSRESFIRFLNIIQFKISKALSEWRKKNIQLLNENDSQCILYDKTFSKLMDVDFKTEKTFIKFYNNMYNKLKTPIS